jgi:hypothetical protein
MLGVAAANRAKRPGPTPPSSASSASYLQSTDVLVKAGSPYYAFGGVAKTGSTLVAVVRKGTDHDVDGNIVKFTSTDGGFTWGTESTVRDNTKDIRDPEIVTLSGGDMLLTFTERTNTSGSTDFVPYVSRSTDAGATWGTAVAITSGFSGWSFISAKILELANGDLLAPLYGNDGSGDYCRVSKSTNGGSSWSNLATVVAAGASSRAWNEPNLTRDGSTIYCAIRSDTSTAGIYLATSSDSGATWSAPTRQFDGSGRPAIFHTQNDDLALVYRHTDPSTGRTGVRFSFDNATSWSSPVLLNSTAVHTYGSWVDLAGNAMGVLWCVEQSSTRSDVLFDTFTYDAAG